MALSEILVCSVCHEALEGATCTGCGRTYGRDAGLPDLTPLPPPDGDVRRRWSLWEALQENGLRAYEFDPPSSLSVGEREDADAFGRFSGLRGRVLDIGCGPQALPTYAARFEGELIGIDPLVGNGPREFESVKGVAEYLPFRDGSFDCVLFATSLDHVLSPKRSTTEAARVTKPGGAVSVWFGETTPARTAPQRLREAAGLLRRRQLGLLGRRLIDGVRHPRPKTVGVETNSGTLVLDLPRGAVDAFHVAHPDGEQISDWLVGAGLEIEAVDDEIVGSCFIRARRPPG